MNGGNTGIIKSEGNGETTFESIWKVTRVLCKCFQWVKQGSSGYTVSPMVGGGGQQVTQQAADTYITVTSGDRIRL